MKRDIEPLSEESLVQDNRLFLSKNFCFNFTLNFCSHHLAMLMDFINKDKDCQDNLVIRAFVFDMVVLRVQHQLELYKNIFLF